MSFLLLVVVCVSGQIIWRLFWSFVRQNEQKREPEVTKRLAEIEGAAWARQSVFDHIESSLKTNPNGLAVISTFQPARYLEELASSSGKLERPRELWEHKNANCNLFHGHAYRANGVHEPPPSGQQNLALWSKQHDSTGNAAPESICLTLTYAQLHRSALNLAVGLIANGAQPETTLLMLIPNGAEYAILLWSCILLRITYVSLDPSCLDISGFTGLKHTLQTLKPQLVVAPDSLSGRAVDVAMSELQLPQPIRVCLSSTRTLGWKSVVDIATDATKCPVDEEELVDAARHDRPNRIHSIMYTSGTSGRPKGCPMRVGGMSHVLHSQSWLVSPKSGAFALQQPHNSRGIAPAQTLQTWNAGGAVVMTGQEFNVRDALEAIKRFGVTFLVLTPAMVHEMAGELAATPLDVGSVKTIQVGGDVITKDVMTKCARLFPRARVCVNHGMTEGGGSFVWPFFNMPVSHIPFFGEICPIGAVAPGAVIRLWDTERKRVARKGELGELHILSPSVIGHYLGGRSDESFYNDRKGRWFNTGDMAMIDDDELVFILGRRKDMIKRAGVAIMPAAIESSIEALTGAQTIVVSAPHNVLGAEPFAILSSFNGKSEAQIKAGVQTALGKDYALGGLVSLKQLGLVEFPLNQTHKVIKSEVQAAVVKYIAVRI